MDKRETLLLVVDSEADGHDICDLLTVLTVNVVVALNENDAVIAFETHKPKLILFARNTVQDNERLYLDLYRNSEHLTVVTHHSLLLCKLTESKLAYELCKRRIFSDYVVDKPRYDLFRLRLCVEHLLTRFNCSEQIKRQESVHSIVEKQVNALTSSLQNMRVEGQSISRDSATRLASLSRCINQESEKIVAKSDADELNAIQQVFDTQKLQRLANNTENTINSNLKRLNSLLELVHSDHVPAMEEFLATIKPDPATIVVIDDNQAFADTLKDILAEHGYRVWLSTNARRGVDIVVQQCPDLILMDINMPELNGIDATRIIKSNINLKNIPIIFLSGKRDQEVVEHVKSLGVNGFISKPTKATIILKKVRSILDAQD